MHSMARRAIGFKRKGFRDGYLRAALGLARRFGQRAQAKAQLAVAAELPSDAREPREQGRLRSASASRPEFALRRIAKVFVAAARANRSPKDPADDSIAGECRAEDRNPAEVYKWHLVQSTGLCCCPKFPHKSCYLYQQSSERAGER